MYVTWGAFVPTQLASQISAIKKFGAEVVHVFVQGIDSARCWQAYRKHLVELAVPEHVVSYCCNGCKHKASCSA